MHNNVMQKLLDKDQLSYTHKGLSWSLSKSR